MEMVERAFDKDDVQCANVRARVQWGGSDDDISHFKRLGIQCVDARQTQWRKSIEP